MTSEAFRSALGELGLRQIDFVRLFAHLSGTKPDPVRMNRLVKGTRAVPPSIVIIVRLLFRLTTKTRLDLYIEAGVKQ